MGWFTALAESAYPTRPHPPLASGPAFSGADARALGWAAQLAYEIEDRPKVDRILAAWGWRFVASLSVPLPAPFRGRALGGYVAQAGNDSIVAFAGTEPEYLQDWLRDFTFVPNGDGVHAGFAKGVDSIIARLTVVATAAPGDIWLTGHSLGAAIAALAAHRLCATGSPSAARIQAVYGCGMPRLGTERFATRYVGLPIAGGRTLGAQTFRLVYGDDVVPHVPPSQTPFDFRHVGQALRAPHAGWFDPASIEAAPGEPAGAVDFTLMKRLLSGLMPGGAAGLPAYPAQNAGVAALVATLPRALRDHMMDRYLGAMR